MDVNEYMKRSLEAQERTATALEALLAAGLQVNSITHHSCGKTTGETKTVKQDEPKEPAKETKKEAVKKEETKQADKQADADAAAAADFAEPAKEVKKVKRATADEARKALKAYAAIEGNDAAMELLTSLGAPSVSGLAEASTDEDDKLAQLIAKCA